jgi:hypothetical protein
MDIPFKVYQVFLEPIVLAKMKTVEFYEENIQVEYILRKISV